MNPKPRLRSPATEISASQHYSTIHGGSETDGLSGVKPRGDSPVSLRFFDQLHAQTSSLCARSDYAAACASLSSAARRSTQELSIKLWADLSGAVAAGLVSEEYSDVQSTSDHAAQASDVRSVLSVSMSALSDLLLALGPHPKLLSHTVARILSEAPLDLAQNLITPSIVPSYLVPGIARLAFQAPNTPRLVLHALQQIFPTSQLSLDRHDSDEWFKVLQGLVDQGRLSDAETCAIVACDPSLPRSARMGRNAVDVVLSAHIKLFNSSTMDPSSNSAPISLLPTKTTPSRTVPHTLTDVLEWVRKSVLTLRTDPSEATWVLLEELCFQHSRTQDLVDLSTTRWLSVVELKPITPSEATHRLRYFKPFDWKCTDRTIGFGDSTSVFAHPRIPCLNSLPLPLLLRRVRKSFEYHLSYHANQRDDVAVAATYIDMLRAGVWPAVRTAIIVCRAFGGRPRALAAYRVWKAVWSEAKKLVKGVTTKPFDDPDAWEPRFFCGSIHLMTARTWLHRGVKVTPSQVSHLHHAVMTALSKASPTPTTTTMLLAVWRSAMETMTVHHEKVPTTAEQALRLVYFFVRARDRRNLLFALDHLRTMHGLELGSSPEIEAVLVGAYVRMGDASLAEQHYKRCVSLHQERGTSVPDELDHAILEVHVKVRNWPQVREWVDKAAESGRELELWAIHCLIKAYFRAGEPNEAARIFSDAVAKGKANAVIRTTFARLCFGAGDFAAGFEAIRGWKGGIGDKGYHALVAVLVSRGRWEDAIELLKEAMRELSKAGGVGLGRLISDVLWTVSGGVLVGGVDGRGNGSENWRTTASPSRRGATGGEDYGRVGVQSAPYIPLVIGGGHVAKFREFPQSPRVEPDGTVIVRVEEAVQRLEEVLRMIREVTSLKPRDSNIVVRMSARTVLEIIERARLGEATRFGNKVAGARTAMTDDDESEDGVIYEGTSEEGGAGLTLRTPTTGDTLYEGEGEPFDDMDGTFDLHDNADEDHLDFDYDLVANQFHRIREVTSDAIERNQKLSYSAVRLFLHAIAVGSNDPDAWQDVLQYLVSREFRLDKKWAQRAEEGLWKRDERSSFAADVIKGTILELAEQKRWTATLKLWYLVSQCRVQITTTGTVTEEPHLKDSRYPMLYYILGDPDQAHANFFLPLFTLMGREESAVGHLQWLVRSCMQTPHRYLLSPITYTFFMKILAKHQMWGDVVNAATYWLSDIVGRGQIEMVPVMSTFISKEELLTILREATQILENANRRKEADRMNDWWKARMTA
ncbi:hypothetical protein HDU93_009268 [Gonapodya sp. JEL0774]|nr:hypothetical protein HDU93_009268 [Gonapodya sp. JEL0774]